MKPLPSLALSSAIGYYLLGGGLICFVGFIQSSFWPVLVLLILGLNLFKSKTTIYKSWFYSILMISIPYLLILEGQKWDLIGLWCGHWLALTGVYLGQNSQTRKMSPPLLIIALGTYGAAIQIPTLLWIFALGLWAWVLLPKKGLKVLGGLLLWCLAACIAFKATQLRWQSQMNYGLQTQMGFSENWVMGTFDSDALGPEAHNPVLLVRNPEALYLAGTRYGNFNGSKWNLLPNLDKSFKSGQWVEFGLFAPPKQWTHSCTNPSWIHLLSDQDWLFLPRQMGAIALKSDEVEWQKGYGVKANRPSVYGYCPGEWLEPFEPLDDYLLIPSSLKLDLELWIKNHGVLPHWTPKQKVQKVLHDLSQGHYTLRPDFKTKFPMREFLQQNSGFCEYYASAAALLLRNVGISTRVVRGFAGGSEINSTTRIYRAQDAHAWVEWYDSSSQKWQILDPTPVAWSSNTAHASLKEKWLAAWKDYLFVLQNGTWKLTLDTWTTHLSQVWERFQLIFWSLLVCGSLIWIGMRTPKAKPPGLELLQKAEKLLHKQRIHRQEHQSIGSLIQQLSALPHPSPQVNEALELLKQYENLRWVTKK